MDEIIKQQFDFSEVNPEIRSRVIERDVRFDFTKQQVEGGLIEMGRILVAQKADLQHGQWLGWLESKEMSQSTAQRFMQVSVKFSNYPHVGNMGIRVLALLSQDSTPESARTEAIEKAENGETLTIKQTKSLIESKKRIEALQQELDAAKKELGSANVTLMYREDASARVEELEVALEAEKNKPAIIQTVEKVPADYPVLISERDSLVDEKGRLLNQIKRLKDNQVSEVEQKISQKLREFDDEFNLKNAQLKAVQDRIDFLRESTKQMDKTAGDLVACKKACDHVRGYLLDISIALRDLFEDHKLTESAEREMRHLCGELEQGAVAFRKYLDGETFVQIGEE